MPTLCIRTGSGCPEQDFSSIGWLSTSGPVGRTSAVILSQRGGGPYGVMWGNNMVSIVSTVAYLGLEARSVEVQCQVAPGVVSFAVVGLPDKAVAESRERERAAISALGLALSPKRITINLSPADLPKEGSHYGLPIALALLGAMGLVDAETLAQYVVVGELGLDG